MLFESHRFLPKAVANRVLSGRLISRMRMESIFAMLSGWVTITNLPATGGRLLATAHCSLLTAYCSLLTAHYPLARFSGQEVVHHIYQGQDKMPLGLRRLRQHPHQPVDQRITGVGMPRFAEDVFEFLRAERVLGAFGGFVLAAAYKQLNIGIVREYADVDLRTLGDKVVGETGRTDPIEAGRSIHEWRTMAVTFEAFATAPNFEAPTDGGGNNVYDVTVDGTWPAEDAADFVIKYANSVRS